MIDDQRTLEIYGYTSNELAPSSNKRIVVLCADCGRYGTSTKYNYKNRKNPDLCKVCLHIGENNNNWKGGDVDMVCKQCGNEYKVERYRELITRFCSYECRDAWTSAHTHGENSPTWKGGITPESIKFRTSNMYAEWRMSVFKRDDYTCQECGERGGITLNAHHILPYADWKEPRFSLNMKNGITLCEDCHRKTYGKEYKFFNKYFDIANGVNN